MDTRVAIPVGGELIRFNYEPYDAALFLALGAALAEIQTLEFHFVTMLGLMLSGAETTHDQVTEEYFQKTLGTVAKKLRGEVGDPQLADTLDEVVRNRNFVVHAYLRERKWPMGSSADYAVAIRELDELAKFFRNSYDTITIALRKAKDLKVWLVSVDPVSGLPQVR